MQRHQRPATSGPASSSRAADIDRTACDARLNAAARRRDFRIAGSREAHFVIDQARTAEDQVRVAVDKSGHDHAAGGIDLTHTPGFGQLLNTARGTGIHDHTVLYQYRAVRDDSEFA